MALERVGGQAENLDAPLGEFGLKIGNGAELRRAHRSVVFGMREEDGPAVAYILVEVNWASRRVGLEVGGDAAQAKTAALLALAPDFVT